MGQKTKTSISDFVKRRRASKPVQRVELDPIKAKLESGELVTEALEVLHKHARTEFGQPIRWTPFFEELLEAELDLRLASVYVSGIAQSSKTFSNALMFAYLSQYLGLRLGWVYPQQKLLDTLVPQQHTPLLTYWSGLKGAKPKKGSQTSNRVYDVGVGRAVFTALGSQQKGGAAAGTGIVAFTADVVCAEETSQCDLSQLAPIRSRVEQSISTASPLRYLGTYGGGSGIELLMEKLDYSFWPHVKCPHCKETVDLNPFGCLLKPVLVPQEGGGNCEVYLSEVGAPLDWYGKQDNSPYFGCPLCSGELPDTVRQGARFKCVKTGMWWSEFRATIGDRWKKESLDVGFTITPAVRHKPGRIVAKLIIEAGESGESPSDWCEQQLGLPSRSIANSISPRHIVNALEKTWEVPPGWQTVTVGGVDQGRSQWYSSLIEVAYDPKLPAAKAFNTACVNIKSFHFESWFDTAQRLAEADIICVDAKPTIYLGAQFSRETGAQLCVQVDRLRNDFVATRILDGGEDYTAINISNQKWPRSLITLFAKGSVCLPPSLLDQIHSKAKNSPLHHLQGPSWDAKEGRMVHAPDGNDDIFYSLMFAVAGFGIYLVEPSLVLRDGGWGWWN